MRSTTHFSLEKPGEKYSILVSLSYRPSVCDKAALVGELSGAL